ncbi:hypothetical protein I3842_13G092300 [Carya illinoinensis]|uniref:Uncharacterized protein n=1 Tax=Carya illinoinensis TaxID=32201 RepID=A0A922DCR5_CARIL|nr:hypothetical protein I3842_13G092300 [Carya illinoinensis]
MFGFSFFFFFKTFFEFFNFNISIFKFHTFHPIICLAFREKQKEKPNNFTKLRITRNVFNTFKSTYLVSQAQIRNIYGKFLSKQFLTFPILFHKTQSTRLKIFF